jgi:predicted AAA+ superfamily ATPase
MVAHYHGQVWNATEFGRSIGTSENTARRYLDILAGAYMVRVLPPWFENLKKRQVKAPKIYIRDSGICHSLLQIPSYESLTGHPEIGASWEGFALEHAIAAFRTRDAYYWAPHAGAPGSSRSMRIALHDLGLSHLYVIYHGEQVYPLDEKITVIPLEHLFPVAERLNSGEI